MFYREGNTFAVRNNIIIVIKDNKQVKMKKVFLSVIAAMTMMTAAAQTKTIRPIEVEMHVGATRPIGNLDGSDSKTGPHIGLEMRYNFKNSPFDAGLMVDMTSAVHSRSFEDVGRMDQSNRTVLLSLAGDYNFGQGNTVNPFAGIGLGVGIHDALNDVYDETNDNKTTFALSPRVGVELWRHLRVTLAANISCKYYNNVALTIGYVIGGGLKN